MEIADQIRQWLLAVAAIGGGFFAWRAFKRERRRDELRDVERRQEQAREIAAWLAVEKVPLPSAQGHPRMAALMPSEWPVTEVLVSNQSSAPVYDVRASVRHRDGEEPPLQLHLVQALPKRETPIQLSDEEVLRLRTGGADDVQAAEVLGVGVRRPVGEFLVAIQFRDAGGQWWERTALGVLSPIEEPTPGESAA